MLLQLPLGGNAKHLVVDFVEFGAKIVGKLSLFFNGLLGSMFLYQCQQR